MVWLILAMLVVVALAAAVVGMVAAPARREGRPLLTPRGEEVFSGAARRTEKVVSTAKDRTGSVAAGARSKAEQAKAKSGRGSGGDAG